MSEDILRAIYNDDCLNVLKTLDENSIDSLVTDPPAGIAFMGKAFDSFKSRDHFIQEMEVIFRECLRVMKPGGHGLVWGLPKTSHWTATALENAGFEIRDCISHLFGTGFPKSLDVSKAILKDNPYQPVDKEDGKRLWEGYGTALKPAVEFWHLVRKPLSEKTVAKNVLKWGTGALDIDASRIDVNQNDPNKRHNPSTSINAMFGNAEMTRGATLTEGRFPANLVLSHNDDCEDACTDGCPVKILDEQSGILKNGGPNKNLSAKLYGNPFKVTTGTSYAGDKGGASRFFYCSKASRSDRNAGCEDMEKKYNDFQRESSGLSQGRNPITGERSGKRVSPQSNNHPTVKNTKLMEYLINLISPPNAIILDPFAGSGSTLVAAKRLGFGFVGIEKEQEYFEIAKARINHDSI